MSLPTKVKVGGIVYSISKTSRAIVNNSNKILMGRVVYSASKIEIYDGMIDDQPVNEQSQWETVWHEILHAITTHMKIELGDDEEDIIDGLSHALYALMKDNPDLFKEGV